MGSIEDRSKILLGRSHRLRVLAGIASARGGIVVTKHLAEELGLHEAVVSKELTVLAKLGLLEPGPRSGERPYKRVESGFWQGCSALFREWSDDDGDALVLQLVLNAENP